MKNQKSQVTLHFFSIQLKPINNFLFKKISSNFRWLVVCTLLLFSSFSFLFAQPTIAWERNYGGSAVEQGEVIQSTSDGGFVTASYSYSDDGDVLENFGGSDWWVTKKNATGDIEWQINLGGGIQDFPTSIEPTLDGGYIIIGSTLSTVQPSGTVSGPTYGQWDVWVVKLNMYGDLLWEKNYGGSGHERGFDIKVADQFGYMFVAHTDSEDNDINFNDGGQDIWVVLISEEGEIFSSNTHGGSEGELAEKIIPTDDGFFLIAGTTFSNDGDISSSKGDADFWTFKVNLQADLIWEKTYGGSEGDRLKDCIMTDDGGFLLVGASNSSDIDVSNNLGSSDRWMIKLNADGDKEWDKNYGNNSINSFNDVVQTADGKYLLLDEKYDVTLVDEQGNEEWKWEYPLVYDDYNFFDITTTENGGFAIIGSVVMPTSSGFNSETLVVNFGPITTPSCPDDLSGFVALGEFNGHKYYLSEGTSGAPAAQDVADANGGYLAVINSQEENDFIQQNISEMVYIGLNDFDAEGDLVWVNGDPLDFDNINPCGFCNENADDQDFIVMQPWDGAWSFSNFYNQRKYLIEVPCNSVTPPVNPDDCAFGGSYNIVSYPKQICIEEDNNGYTITSAIEINNNSSAFDYFQSQAQISLEGEVQANNQTPVFNFSSLSYLGHSKNYPWVYVYHASTNKIRICDYNYFEMWNICVPNLTPSFPIINTHTSLSTLQITELDDSRVMVIMDSYVGIFNIQGGQLIAENPNFILGGFFGEVVLSNDGGYYVQSSEQIVKFNEDLLIEWTHQLTINSTYAEAAILPIPNNEDALYTFVKNDQQSFVVKLDNTNGEILWQKDFTPNLPPNSNWIFNNLRNGVATLDGGFVTKLDYHYLQPNSRGAVMIKIDGQGNVVWEKDYAEPFWYYEVNYATNDGGYILTDYSSNKIHYVKLNSLGEIDPLCNDDMGLADLKRKPNGDIWYSNIDNLTKDEFISLFFVVTNEGLVDVTEFTKLNVYLSTNTSIDSDDVLVFSQSVIPLDIGEQFPLDILFDVPELDADEYRIIISIDDEEIVGELSESNNIYFSPIFEYIDNTSNNCPDNYQGFVSLGEFGGSKYFISEDVENPVPAQAVAESLGGYLATIDSQEENDFIFSQISEIAYIGINDAANEQELAWENGDPVNYTNFDLCGICNENSDEMDFVVMHSWNGGWSWSNIFNQRKYIVEVPCTNTITTDPSASTLIALLPNVSNEELTEKPELRLEKLFPNPTSKVIFAKINSSTEEVVNLQIFDSRGVLVKNQTVNISAQENTIRIDVSQMSPGFYSIYIPRAEKEFSTQRFIIH